MAEENNTAVPWYQEKKWVVAAGLICGVGLGLILLEPVIDDVVPVVLSESASEPDLAEPDPAESEPGGAESGDTSETTAADDGGTGDPDSTTESGSEDPIRSQPDGPYELVIIRTEDVSVDETILKVVSAELNLYPIDKDKLRDALDLELEQFRGDTHAVSVKVFYDRREGGSPAFGAWNWAPEGDWSKAEDGDPESWDEYEWNEPDINKFDSPDSCNVPNETELDLSGAYYDWQLIVLSDADGDEPSEDGTPGDPLDDPDAADPADDNPKETDPRAEPEPADPDVMVEVAEEVGTTLERLSEALDNISNWVGC